MPGYRNIEVPDQYIHDVRLYMGDFPEFNRLIEGQEASNEKVRLAIRITVDHFNNIPPKLAARYTVEDFPNGQILIHGAIIELLRMNGIVQSRNFLQFNDSNVQFQVNDKAQDYRGWVQSLIQQYQRNLEKTKVALNAEEGYDYHPSPEAFWPLGA